MNAWFDIKPEFVRKVILRRRCRTLPHVILIALTMLMLSCSGSDADDSTSGAAESAFDSRFATAESLLAYYNTLNTQLPPDLPNLLPLFHLETEFQKKEHQIMSRIAGSASYDLEVAMWRTFGEGIAPKSRVRISACGPATLRSVQDERAEGEYHDQFRKVRPLHLIKVGGRWYVSGYTLEYDTDTDKRKEVENLTNFVLNLPASPQSGADDYLRPVIARIRNGEFKTADDARTAWLEASRARFDANSSSRRN